MQRIAPKDGFKICRVGNLLPTESQLMRVGKQVAHSTRLYINDLLTKSGVFFNGQTIRQKYIHTSRLA